MDSDHLLDHTGSPDEQKWERIWTTAEIRSNSANWSLAGDIGLFHLLNDFSYKLISRTHEMENEVDTLVHKTKIASVKINNVINDFHMLSNLQFVENRVYDEEVQDSPTQEKQVPEKTKEQREAEMLPKVVKAIELGLSVLEQAFDKINVDEISDSEDEEDLSSEGRTILEPKDPYEQRSLPYVIGSEEFQNDDFAGLKEYIEEEAAEISGEDQTVSESESSFSEDEEPMPLDDISGRRNQMTNERKPAESISDNLSSSDESELFGSEKDEKDFASELTLDAKKNQVDQVLKSNIENVERKNTRQSSVSSMQSRLKLPQVLPSPKKEEKENDDDDLFGNEDLSDDESPFRKKTGLFKSDVTFNDDQDMFGDDLFGEKVKPKETPSQKIAKPSIEKEKKIQAPRKESKDSLLFGPDESDDDMFSALTKTKLPHVPKPQKQEPPAKSGNSLKSSSEVLPAKKAEKAFDFKDNSSNSLFGDDSDGDDLFSKKYTKKKYDLVASEEDDLFGSVIDKPLKTTMEKAKVSAPQPVKNEKKMALFDDSKTLDQPDNTTKTKSLATAPISKKVPKLFDDSDSSEQETKEEIKPSVPTTKETKKDSSSLFGSEEDLFKQESSKPKPAKIDQEDDFSLFSDKKLLLSKPIKQEDVSVKELSSQLLFEENDSFDLFTKKISSKKEALPQEKLPTIQPSSVVEKPEIKTITSASTNENITTVSQKSVYSESIKEKLGTNEASFDSPVNVSNTLSVVSKNRVKVSAKRRKPTRKGRLAALQDNDIIATSQDNDEQLNPSSTTTDQKNNAQESSASVDDSTHPGKMGLTHKEKEKQKKNIMSQLMSEVAASKVKSTVLKEDSDDEVDLFSSKRRASSAKSDFSFLSPLESGVQPSKIFLDSEQNNGDSKSEESNVLHPEGADNEDFFTEPSFQGFRSSISHKASVLDFDDDDDDLFKSIKDSPLPKLKASNATNDSNDIFSEEANDIFADLQKEKYEMFPSQLYDDDDDDGDIFGTSVKPSSVKVVGDSSSNLTLKKEPEKKPVNLFDDPLTGMLQE